MLHNQQQGSIVWVVGAIVIVGWIVKMYLQSDYHNLKCVISRVDGETYCVRDRKQVMQAADLLAQVTQKCKQLVEYMGHRYPNVPEVQRLVANFNPRAISETLPTSEYTAYSENKGQKLAFCMQAHKNRSQLIDINTLTFVAIHELAHIMTEQEGHVVAFWQNFKFLLLHAKETGLYHPVDYKQNPQSYCGMTITDNPIYDFQ